MWINRNWFITFYSINNQVIGFIILFFKEFSALQQKLHSTLTHIYYEQLLRKTNVWCFLFTAGEHSLLFQSVSNCTKITK